MKLKTYINSDNTKKNKFFSKDYLLEWILRPEQFYIKKFLKYLRLEEYYTFYKPNKFLRYYYFRKKNVLGARLGFFIPAGCFDLGLHLAHYGSVIINPKARIGKNCTIHGNCCIGNAGNDEIGLPILGDQVDIGQGAQILGDLTIANRVKIGAGTIVLSSILEEGATVVGIPGKIINRKQA